MYKLGINKSVIIKLKQDLVLGGLCSVGVENPDVWRHLREVPLK